MVEYTDRGHRVSHCQPSEALAALASDEMEGRTAPHMPEVAQRQLQEWLYAYSFGEWARGEHVRVAQ